MDSQVYVFSLFNWRIFEVNPLILLVGLCFFRPPLPTKKDNSPATRQVRSFELLDRIMACFFVVGASGVDQVWAKSAKRERPTQNANQAELIYNSVV